MAEARFLNYYQCPACKHKWTDLWDATCDDDCPSCGHRHVSPYHSADVPEVPEEAEMANAQERNKPRTDTQGRYSALQVLQSGAGYYVGRTYEHTEGDCKGLVEPGSRESDYYPSAEEAQKALDSGEFGRDSEDVKHLYQTTDPVKEG